MHIEELVRQADTCCAAAPRVDATAALSTRRIIEVQPGLRVVRESARTSFESMLYEPNFCVILRGKKQTTLGTETFPTRAGDGLIISHDLAVQARIVQAPYMSLLLRLDIALLRSLADDVAVAGVASTDAAAMTVRAVEPALIDALRRYLSLTSSPQATVLGPLIVKEIHYRLLMAPGGAMLRKLAVHDVQASAVARAAAVIRRDFRGDIGVPALARLVGMSASSFHRHFKAVMSSTPLQYHKDLRLLEARRLITQQHVGVTTAAFDVGYESASQFTREYSRKFGVAPSRDVVAMTGAM